VDINGLEVGYRLIPLVDKSQGGDLMAKVKGVRRKLSQELGFLVQPVHIRDNLDLTPNTYRISLFGVPVGEANLQPDQDMAINPGQVFGAIQGNPTKDPAFGLDAFWIDRALREQAQTMGYTVVDPSTVIATHLSQILQVHAHELLGHEETQKLLDVLSESAPKLVQDLTPDTLNVGVILKVLQNLLLEKIPIKDMRTIAETMAEYGPLNQDPAHLTSVVRAALSRSIMQLINGMGPELPIITLDPSLEQILQQSLIPTAESAPSIEPGLAEQLQQSLAGATQQMEMNGHVAVLVTAPAVRPWLSRMLKHTVPGLWVLAYSEVPDDKQVKVVQVIGQQLASP